MSWVCRKITITAGTPQRLAGLPTYAQRLRIRPLAASGGLVYVINQDPSITPMVTNDSTKVDQLAPALAAVPGGLFNLERLAGGPPINVQEYGVDGAANDNVIVAWEI